MRNFFSMLKMRAAILRDLFRFLIAHKLWWLIPMIVCLAMLGVLMFIGQSSPLGPFIYVIF